MFVFSLLKVPTKKKKKIPNHPPSVLTFNHQIYPAVKAQSKTHPVYWLEGDVMTLWLSGSSWRENCILTHFGSS